MIMTLSGNFDCYMTALESVYLREMTLSQVGVQEE